MFRALHAFFLVSLLVQLCWAKQRKCSALDPMNPMDRDYSFLNIDARGSTYNSFGYKGYKLKNGTKYATMRASSARSCAKACLEDSSCYSYQYGLRTKKCSLSNKSVDEGGKNEAQFCRSNNKYMSGWIIDADD